MKKLLTILLIFLYSVINAADYYIDADATSGDGSIGNPWSFAQFNAATKVAGNSYLFQRGDTFPGAITLSQSGTSGSPIILSAYGTGADPIVSGFETISGWTNEGGGIYSKTITVESDPDIVTVNGVQYAMGRTPNSDRYNQNYNDYYHIDSYSGFTQITDSENPSSTTDWTGADMVVKSSNYWDWNKYPITNHSGTTLTFTNPGNDANGVGFGYFIQNDLRTLDQLGEWYYGGGKFYMYFGAESTGDYVVKVSTKDKVIDVNTMDYITIQNLKIEGGNVNGVGTNFASNAHHLTIDNCDFDFNYMSIYGHTAYDMTVTNCNIIRSSRTGILQTWNSDGTYFANNTIDSTGLVIGAGISYTVLNLYQGIGVSITYSKLTKSTNKTIIENNIVTNSGYSAIHFSGDSSIVRNNYVNTYCLNKTDGAGIYHGDNDVHSNMVIDKNIVLYAMQNDDKDGLPLNSTADAGFNIYLDYGSTGGFVVSDNTVAYTGGIGIMLHGNQNTDVYGNTIFDCGYGVRFQELDGMGSPTRNDSIVNNIIVSKTAQISIWARSVIDDFDLYGTIDYNTYARPIDLDPTFATLVNTWSATYRTFSGWQTYTTQDANSTVSTHSVDSDSELDLKYNATKTTTAVPIIGSWKDLNGITHTNSVTLQPYTSIVLVQTTYVPPATNTLYYDNRNGKYVNLK